MAGSALSARTAFLAGKLGGIDCSKATQTAASLVLRSPSKASSSRQKIPHDAIVFGARLETVFGREVAVASGARIGMTLAEGTRPKSNSAGKRTLEFVKYQGLGNDFILVDNRSSSEPRVSPSEAAKLCDRNFGIGGDGVIFVLPGQRGSDYTMRIYNSDSSEPEMCGNGIRCMARFIAELEGVTSAKTYTIDTLAGQIVPYLREDGQVVVDMGTPILKGADVPTTLEATREGGVVVAAPLEVGGRQWEVTCVSMGNPHAVVFSEKGAKTGLDLSAFDLRHWGPQFETDPAFPARINTHFVQVDSPSHVTVKVWERGAGPTLACGTGACAIVVAGVLEGRLERSCVVELPGGPLEIEWRESDNRVYMTGPAESVFRGSAPIPALMLQLSGRLSNCC